MPLQVYTAQLPHRGRPGYYGRDAFNITRGTGGGAGDPFAPSDGLLAAGQACKRAAKKDEARLELAFAWYRELFLEEMRLSYRRHRGAWLELLARERVVLCCYCGTHGRCHRRVVAEILARLGAVDCGELAAGRTP